MPGSEKKKRKQFEVDPSIFEPGPKESKVRRYLIEPAKSLAKFGFYGLLFVYPLALVILGVLFGGLVFWGLLGGSLALIGVLLWKAGYAKNYAGWNVSMKRQLVGLSLGFVLAVGFFLGLAFLQVWFIPVFLGVIAIGLAALITFYRF